MWRCPTNLSEIILSPDGPRIVTGSEDQSATVWAKATN
jgi:hypothetical protein